MSTYFASLNGLQIVSGSLLVPAVGAWTADLQLATSQQVSGNASVVIGNLTLQGFVYRSESYGGQVRARVVGGYGGWRKAIAAQGYGTGSGVQLSTVLQDAASACGEQVNVSSGQTIGNAFARVAFRASVAGDVLWQMLSQGIIPAWYVAPSGVTQVTAWPTTTVQTPFTVTDQKTDEGMVEVATEDYASWLPGCQFSAPQIDGTLSCAGVEYVWNNDGKFRLQVLTGTLDRVLGPLQQIIEREVAPLRFFGRYEYSISNATTSTIDGHPTDTTLGLPDLQSVPLANDSIAQNLPPNGQTAHIMFTNGLPTKPICVWTSRTDATNPAAKLGDTVQSMVTGALTILPGSTLTITSFGGSACSGILLVQGQQPITGTVTTGSSQVSLPP